MACVQILQGHNLSPGALEVPDPLRFQHILSPPQSFAGLPVILREGILKSIRYKIYKCIVFCMTSGAEEI